MLLRVQTEAPNWVVFAEPFCPVVVALFFFVVKLVVDDLFNLSVRLLSF